MSVSCISSIGEGDRTSSGHSCWPRLWWGHRCRRRWSGIAAWREVGSGDTGATWVNASQSLTDRFSRLSGKTGWRTGSRGTGRRYEHRWGRDCWVRWRHWRVSHRLGRLSAKWRHRRKTWNHWTVFIDAVEICRRCRDRTNRSTDHWRHWDGWRLNWLWRWWLRRPEWVITGLSVPITWV